MHVDHYATLGLSPDSEDVVIRAAYHALMRRYHPDKNPNAAKRAQAITAAYEVLGDPRQREAYDWLRGYGPKPQAERSARRPTGKAFALTACAVAAALLVTLFVVTPADLEDTGMTGAKMAAAPSAPLAAKVAPRIAPAQAAVQQLAPANTPAPPPISTAEAKPVLQASLPQPVQPLSRPAAPRQPAAAAAQPEERPEPRRAADDSQCDSIKNRVAAAMCKDPRLALANQQLASNFYQAVRQSDADQQARLFKGADRFRTSLEACASSDCMRDVLNSRIREISQITGGAPRAQR